MRLHLIILTAALALAGCDAPPPTPASDPNLAAQTQTSVVTVPDAPSGPAASPPVQPQVELSTAPPPAKDLKVIQFAVGSDAVGDQAQGELSRFARYLSKFRKSVIITGFTRRMPDLAAAQSLSARRAEAVRRFLILHDVGAPQIAASGRGDAQSVDQGTTEEAMARNDRVELTIVQKP